MGVTAATQDPIAQMNVRMTILDKIAVRDAMKRAKAATRRQVYVIMGVTPDGKGFIANRNVRLDFTGISVLAVVDTVSMTQHATMLLVPALMVVNLDTKNQTVQKPVPAECMDKIVAYHVETVYH